MCNQKIYTSYGEQTGVIDNLIYSPTMDSEGDVINLYHLQLRYEDAGEIFETINQRGKGLDPMDLLKNVVFRQVDRSKFKELNMNWKYIIGSLEKTDEKPLRFLRYFIMANYDTFGEKDGILREDRIYTWLSEMIWGIPR